MTRAYLAAVSSIGLAYSAAAVLGLSEGGLGPWPAFGLVVLGWATTAFLLVRRKPASQSAPPRTSVGLRLGEREFSRGDIIVREGDAASSLSVIVAGKVQVWRNDDHGSRINIAELVPGQIFGELGLLNGGSRTASIEAAGAVRLLEVPLETLEILVAESGAIATPIGKIADSRQAG